jgi:hypothetical protein
MNLLDAYVTEILSEPTFNNQYASEDVTWWEVKVVYECWGGLSTTYLTFKSKEEAELVKEGYHFLA